MDVELIAQLLGSAPVPLTMMIAVWVYKLDRRMLKIETKLEVILKEVSN